MTRLDGAIRKAAILISALDRDSADALLDQMPAEQAARVRNAVLELPEVSQQETEAVLREFFAGQGPGNKPAAIDRKSPPIQGSADVELDIRLLDRIQRTGPEELGRVEAAESQQNKPAVGRFEFLRQTSPEILARCLQNEHPQVVAVVLAHLPAQEAAEVLSELEEAAQLEVLHRIAALGETDPEILAKLEEDLASLLRRTEPRVQVEETGVQAVEAILEAAPNARHLLLRLSEGNSPLLARMSNEKRALAGDIRRKAAADLPESSSEACQAHATSTSSVSDLEASGEASIDASVRPTPSASSFSSAPALTAPPPAPWRFTEVVALNDGDMARLFQAADPRVTLLAVLGAEPSLAERLLRQMPAAEARRFRQRMRADGPLQLRDITAAQQRIGRMAALLERRGLLKKPASPRRFAAAA